MAAIAAALASNGSRWSASQYLDRLTDSLAWAEVAVGRQGRRHMTVLRAEFMIGLFEAE
jgi:hypothetical protein